jgi:hypothetical protein
MTGHDDNAGLDRMSIYPMVAASSGVAPTVSLKLFDEIPYLHSLQPLDPRATNQHPAQLRRRVALHRLQNLLGEHARA